PTSWVVRENDSMRKPTAYPDYPHPDAKMVRLYPSGNGNEIGNLLLQSSETSQQTLVDDHNSKGSELASSKSSDNRLLFATAPLNEPLHISGTAKINIKLSADRPAANLSVWVVSLPWKNRTRKINDNIITRGWADPQNYQSMTESKPLEPGKFYDLNFTLQPDDQIIPAGQQIGLMIFSSDHDFTLWPEPGTELTVSLSDTYLELPMVGGKDAVDTSLK
ncbi:MAG: CocE/NonD family hydrolase C-terminal non-catalytic domain-containing protein, partial [Planctomycetota bacterium]